MFPPDHSTSKHEVDHIMSHGDKDKVRKGSINETIVVYGAVGVSFSCRADLDSHPNLGISLPTAKLSTNYEKCPARQVWQLHLKLFCFNCLVFYHLRK